MAHCTELRDCTVCGRPVEVTVGKRGVKKMMHRECVEYNARLNQLDQLLSVMRFQDTETARKRRGDLQVLINQRLNQHNLLMAPDSTEEYNK